MFSQNQIKILAQEVKNSAEAWETWKNATEDYDESVKDRAMTYMQDLSETLTEAVRNDKFYPDPGTDSWSDEDNKAVIAHSSTLSDELYEEYKKKDIEDDSHYIVSKALDALSTFYKKCLPYAYGAPDLVFFEFGDEIASATE